ncbi:MAG: hypothetical protein IKK82_10555 [Kiritimatiellae bacterium]|nr:hypothetical protein [Kiritimatiellia bacterium]
MKMLFALVAAMSGLPGLCAAEWVVSGDWELLVKDGGRALSCRVDPPPRVSVAGERQEKLPIFNPKKYECFRGRQFKGVYALGCSVKFALVPESVKFRDAKGRLLVRGVDYEIDGPWGLFGRLEKGRIGPGDRVFADYAYRMRRIDSVLRNASGRLVYRKGTPHVATPLPPETVKGERRVLNVYVDAQTKRLTTENVFPVLEDSYPVQHTISPYGDTVAARLVPKTMTKLKNGGKVRILAWGDSITETLDYYLTDKSKRWQEVFVGRLRKIFPKAEIELLTAGWDGHHSRDFLNAPPESPRNFKKAILDVKPDLVISEFLNDFSICRTPEQLKKLYEDVYLARFREQGIEWIIMTPSYARPEQMKIVSQKNCDEDKRTFVPCLRDFAQKHGIALADASKRWGRLWRQGLPYMTLLCNDINHPDPRGLVFFADALIEDIFTAPWR